MALFTGKYALHSLWIVILLGFLVSLPAQSQPERVEQRVPVDSVAWSPNGDRLAILTGETLKFYSNDYQLIDSISFTTPPLVLSWSPDGTKLAVGHMILESSTLRTLLNINSNIVVAGWNNDGSQIWTTSPDGDGIAIYSSTTGNLLNILSETDRRIFGADWSPDGTRFAILDGASQFSILDVTSEQVVATYPTISTPAPLVWSPDSARIAGSLITEVEQETAGSIPTAGSNALIEVYVWDASTGQVLNRFSGLPEYLTVLRWSSNGMELAGGTPNGSLYIWNTDTNIQTTYHLGEQLINDIEFSPYGGRIAIATNSMGTLYAELELNLSSNQSLPFMQMIDGLSLEIIVPDPSPERLQAIAAACAAPPQVVQAITSAAAATDAQAPDAMSALVDTVDALPADAIPPGCATDLRAVAEAMAAQGE